MIAIVEVDTKEQLKEILSHYTGWRDELIPLLQEAQEQFRYLPEDVLQDIAKFLKLSESTVYGVATFYSEFRFTPPGRKIIKLCQGPACHMRGARHIRRAVEKQLGIRAGETTDDFEYTLETTACSGACALPPVVEVDSKVYGRLEASRIGHILTDDEN